MDQLHEKRETRSALALAALGIVYGDIGTSPLYAAREVFNAGFRTASRAIPLIASGVLYRIFARPISCHDAPSPI